MTWGPFLSDLDPIERKARLRSLRALVKVLTGPRGEACRYALLLAEIDQDEDTLAAASAAFEKLPALDRRRILSSYMEVADAPIARCGSDRRCL